MERIAALEAHDLYRFFHAGDDETLALQGVSLRVQAGETVAVVGPSGSGKSTLLACLAGLDEPDGGWVAVAGERITRQPQERRAQLRARRIGVLMQQANLLDHLTVAENLSIAQMFANGRHPEQIHATLATVGLAERLDSYPSQLSGGELARAGIALAMINSPDILLADEPTSEVDSANEELVLELLARRAHEGGGSLVVTHSQTVAAVADRVLHLVDGRLRND